MAGSFDFGQRGTWPGDVAHVGDRGKGFGTGGTQYLQFGSDGRNAGGRRRIDRQDGRRYTSAGSGKRIYGRSGGACGESGVSGVSGLSRRRSAGRSLLTRKLWGSGVG